MYKSRIRNAKQRGKNEKSREIELPDDEQEFAVVERLLGNGRVEVYCQDKELRVVRIRGSMRKFKSKVLIENADLVLIAPWAFEKDRGDLIHKYSYEEKSYLLYQQMLPENIHKRLNKVSGGIGFQADEENEDTVIFGDRDAFGSTQSLEKKPDATDFNIDDI
jgi:translation initiation factor 1A